jgi:hypothetical protein
VKGCIFIPILSIKTISHIGFSLFGIEERARYIFHQVGAKMHLEVGGGSFKIWARKHESGNTDGF